MKANIVKEFYYKIEQGETINFLCEKFNTSKENILRNNKDLKLFMGEWLKIKVNDFLTHIVKPAETLSIISNKYNVTSEKLMQDNNLQTDKLFIGQSIKIY